MHRLIPRVVGLVATLLLLSQGPLSAGETWPQLKFDGRHSGNAPDRTVTVPLGLVGARPLTDAVFTAPVVDGQRVYVVDGSGVAFCFEATSLRPVWQVTTRGGPKNCNNVSSPALAGGYLHFGTMAGVYYVIEAASGKVAREIDCGEPIFSSPVVGQDRVYFATLGSQVYALQPDGTVCWKWDFVRARLRFDGDRWNGAEWSRHLQRRVSNTEQFLCSRDIALDGRTLVIPAGGSVVWLEDRGDSAKPRALLAQHTATLALSVGEDGAVYRQWHWLDNTGQVDILRLGQVGPDKVLRPGQSSQLDFDLLIEKKILSGKEGADYAAGTRTNTESGLLSFSSVSVRGQDVYRCRPEEQFGLCKHGPGQPPQAYAGTYPALASPLLIGDQAVYGGLDGALYVVPLAGGPAWSFKTAFGKALTAPAAVSDRCIYFAGDDGYLYALGPDGRAPLPSQDLGLDKVRSPLTGPLADAKQDRFTSFADWGNTNADQSAIRPPLRLHWIRRYDGTAKQFSSFGGGRMYTHTAEGQVFAVEQETGRLLWRRYFPGVHISYTTPLYHHERLLVPQAGLQACSLRCLDAATGNLLWEAPFAGSPSWNRQQPPVVHKNLAIYMFGTGKYGPDAAPGDKLPWLFEHQNIPTFPASHKPLLRAYDIDTGKEVWTKDFSEYGSGGDDAGVCLMDGRIYYSCYFGHSAQLRGEPGPAGVTAALDPEDGKILWLTTKYAVRGGCTISAQAGRLYLGGYNPLPGTQNRHVWCLDAKDGSLVWQSDPLLEAIHVPTIGSRFIFIHAQYKNGYLLDKQTGKILTTLTPGYKCSRFTLCEPYLLGPAMDVYDLSEIGQPKLLSSGPRLDPSECIGACVSNGRVFYTGHGAGLQACQISAP
jgi:outer membrane protein assembly factor BamB